MDQASPVSPQVEARFRAMAECVPQEDWAKLIEATTDRILRRLAHDGLFADISAEQMQAARETVGALLVQYTNVALTCVAQGEEGEASRGE